LVFYLLALCSKSTACTLPVALLLILWLQKKRIDWLRVRQIAPFVVFGLAMGLIAIWWERYHQETRGPMFALGLAERLIVATHAVWFYVGKLFWPTKLTFIYPQWAIRPKDPFSYTWIVAGIALCVAIYFLRRHVGRSAEVAAAFFVATLGPVLGFIMLYTFRYTFVADHYQYLASIGPIALASAGLTKLSRSLRMDSAFLAVFGISILATLGILTWRQSTSYSDIETLWQTTIEKNPGCWMAENNLGTLLVAKGDFEDGIGYLEKSLQLKSDYPEIHCNLANAYLRKGEIDTAIARAAAALTLYPNEPEPHVMLGTALLTKGLTDEAVAQFLAALKIRPDHSDAHYNLAIALLGKHQISAAIAHYEKAIEARPDFTEALTSLAFIFATSPDATVRNGPRAIELAKEANRLTDGTSPRVLRTLAAAYAETGRFEQAAKTAKRALGVALDSGQPAADQAVLREIRLYEKGLTLHER
jgi:tetratricopeptide (TPR) repeat protein